MLHSFGLIAHARRRVVVAVWVAVLLALGAGVGSIGSSFSTQFKKAGGVPPSSLKQTGDSPLRSVTY